MPAASALPYLGWLDHQQDPPVHLSLRGWQLAAGELIQRMRQARNRLLKPEAAWEDVEEFIITEDKLCNLNNWAEFTHARTKGVHRGSLAPMIAKINEGRTRLYRSSGRSRAIHALRGWLRRRREPMSAEQKRMVSELIDRWKESLSAKSTPPIERLASKHYRRSDDYSLECRANGLWLTRKQASELPKGLRRQARANARSLGEQGWFVTADSDLGQDALEHLTDREVRESLWRQRQQLRESDATIIPMLSLRHADALENGHNHYSALMLYDRVITSPRKIMGMLGDHLDGIRASYGRLEKRLMIEAENWNIGEISPWDRPFLLERLRQQLRFNEEPAAAFHVERMVELIIPELVAIGHWKVESVYRYGEGKRRQWQFYLRRRDGSRAQLWLAPFNPKDEERLNTAGEMTMIRAPWNGSNEKSEAIVSIELSLAGNATHFSHQELTWLCHELGHALHYLAMPGLSEGEDQAFSDDLVEFPSQFLERYVQDPQVLARWASASPNSPLIARRPSFWRHHLGTKIHGLDIHQRFAFSAWLDLAIHKQNPDRASFEETCRKASERFGIAYHPDDRRNLRGFMWGDYAATDYAYPLGAALADDLMVKREDGTIDAAVLASTYRDMLDNVLREGIRAKHFRKQWASWMGEDIETSLRRGVKRQTKALRDLALSACSKL